MRIAEELSIFKLFATLILIEKPLHPKEAMPQLFSNRVEPRPDFILAVEMG